MQFDLKVHVHAPDGRTEESKVAPDYNTDEFLKTFVKAFGLPATSDWGLYDADLDRELDKRKTLEENGVREGHRLHLRKENGEQVRPVPSRPLGQRKAEVGKSDPVVGWAVAINGTDRGKDYKIRSGNNTIGRAESMHICISGDDAISRDKHAIISFDAQTNTFHVRPGEGRGLTYVNDIAVFDAVRLQPYDEIRLGDTKLLFVPFCGDKFIWIKGA